MKVQKKKEFDLRPIQLLVYMPDKILNFNDRVIFGTLYDHLAKRKDVFLVDTALWLDEAIAEKRQGIYAILRESIDFQSYAVRSKIIYASTSVYENFKTGKYSTNMRVIDSASRRWLEDETCIKIPVDDHEIVKPDGLISILTHHVKYDIKNYNIYISGFEASK